MIVIKNVPERKMSEIAKKLMENKIAVSFGTNQLEVVGGNVNKIEDILQEDYPYLNIEKRTFG